MLKEGKSPTGVASFLPISLTSCVAKLPERVLADHLYCITAIKNFYSRFQAGFCKGRSCEDQITQIVQAIENDLNRSVNCSVLTLSKFSKAYSMVW